MEDKVGSSMGGPSGMAQPEKFHDKPMAAFPDRQPVYETGAVTETAGIGSCITDSGGSSSSRRRNRAHQITGNATGMALGYEMNKPIGKVLFEAFVPI